MRILLALLMVSSLCSAKYDQVDNTVRVYGLRNYGMIGLEGFVGSCAFLSGCANSGLGVSSLVAVGGAIAIGDAIRRVFAKPHVMIKISPEGLLYKDVDLVPWDDISRIDCVNITTVRNGYPIICGYQIYLNTKNKHAVPLAIDGMHISESMHSLFALIRKYYSGDIEMKTAVVQETPNLHYVYNLNK